MNKEEYYKRIEKINNRFKTDRVSADEEYQLFCQRNYLSTKYIEHLEKQCQKQKEVINKAIEYICSQMIAYDDDDGDCGVDCECDGFKLLDILKEVE